MPLPDLSDYITTTEASERLGVTADHIGHLLRAMRSGGVSATAEVKRTLY